MIVLTVYVDTPDEREEQRIRNGLVDIVEKVLDFEEHDSLLTSKIVPNDVTINRVFEGASNVPTGFYIKPF
jgi:hypothetical protein